MFPNNINIIVKKNYISQQTIFLRNLCFHLPLVWVDPTGRPGSAAHATGWAGRPVRTFPESLRRGGTLPDAPVLGSSPAAEAADPCLLLPPAGAVRRNLRRRHCRGCWTLPFVAGWKKQLKSATIAKPLESKNNKDHSFLFIYFLGKKYEKCYEFCSNLRNKDSGTDSRWEHSEIQKIRLNFKITFCQLLEISNK